MLFFFFLLSPRRLWLRCAGGRRHCCNKNAWWGEWWHLAQRTSASSSSNETFVSLHTCTNEGEPKGRCNTKAIHIFIQFNWMGASPRSWHSLWPFSGIVFCPFFYSCTLICNHVSKLFILVDASQMEIVLIFILYYTRSFHFIFSLVFFHIYHRCYSIKFISRQLFLVVQCIFFLLVQGVCVLCMLWCGYACYARFNIYFVDKFVNFSWLLKKWMTEDRDIIAIMLCYWNLLFWRLYDLLINGRANKHHVEFV